MKRSWIGAAVLLALLIVALGVTWAMEKIHGPIEEDLNRAAVCAMEDQWAAGEALFRQAQARWEKWDHFRGCFADHTPVEEISAGFRAAEVYCLAREQADFAARCRELARKTAAVGEAHGVSWWNIF